MTGEEPQRSALPAPRADREERQDAPGDVRCSDGDCVLAAFAATRHAGVGATLNLTVPSSIEQGLGLLNCGSCHMAFCAQSVAVTGAAAYPAPRALSVGTPTSSLNATFVVRGAGSNLTLTSLLIQGQRYYAGALYVTNGGYATVTSCVFRDNTNREWWDPVNRVPGSYKNSPDWAITPAITALSGPTLRSASSAACTASRTTTTPRFRTRNSCDCSTILFTSAAYTMRSH